MNGRSYKLIFILLSCCVLFILGFQAYWLRNAYLEKKQEFDRTVYATLETISNTLEQRKKLEALKMTYIIVDGDTIAKTPSKNMRFSSEKETKVVNRTTSQVQTTEVVSVSSDAQVNKDSLVINGKNEHVNIVMNSAKGKKPKIIVYNNNKPHQVIKFNKDKSLMVTDTISRAILEEIEMARLMDKMMTEIKVIDTESEHVDTVAGLIKKSLSNKGLFLPFEFSIRKLSKKGKSVVSQSNKFNEKDFSYQSDLYLNNIISNNQVLLLQFPGRSDFVMAGMRGSLILSLVFSLVIMGAMYYVIRLILAQKKLSEIKNDFVNNMTHELKTPIATIALALDAINNPIVKNDAEKFSDYSRILKEENQKLNRHVERVLQTALFEKGELQLNKKPVDLGNLITAALNTYKLQIDEKKAEVHFSPPPSAVIFNADEQHLKTAFGNLVDNALKYCKESCVLTISLLKVGNRNVVSFKDNGIGIDAEHQKKVFDKFYRVQGGNLHDVKGFGLGLNYVKAIVEGHAGTIELRSEKGRGTEFVIQFFGTTQT